ncbi:host attachment protein [Cupriavidus basilensis]
MWILVADEGIAGVLASRGDSAPLEEVEKITDAGARADNADLRRDAYGRRAQATVQGDAGHPGAHAGRMATVTSSAGEDEIHQEAQLFARRVRSSSRKPATGSGSTSSSSSRRARFLGLLRKALPQSVCSVVTRELDEDYRRSSATTTCSSGWRPTASCRRVAILASRWARPRQRDRQFAVALAFSSLR